MSKEPQLVLDSIYAFPPNRYTLGGTAYLIVKNQGNILIDCPKWDESTAAFIHHLGGISHLILTHRGGLSEQFSKIQSALGCTAIVQEQEAYRVARETPMETFHAEKTWPNGDRLIWTPGHSPGSSCFYEASHGVLFTGRHLLPDPEGLPRP
ncbi:MAG: MBL fold metallo-hydrolase, partial [Cyanobacteria bacterium P01_F01_bin.42]